MTTSKKDIIMNIQYKPIRAEQTFPLRQKVLRPQQNLNEMLYPLDKVTGSFHMGAFAEGEIVGIASVYPESQSGDLHQGDWRLRGMAVSPSLQGQGVGKALIKECLDYTKSQAGRMVWCNARTSAIGFYVSLGFNKVGEEFEIEGIGPHYVAKYLLR